MRCEVLLFAHLADEIGRRRVTVELPEGATVGDLIETLTHTHPVVAAWRAKIAVAVNERYAGLDEAVPSGASIALIPPVSGG